MHRFMISALMALFSFQMVHSYTIEEIQKDLNTYQQQIQKLKAGFLITMEGLPTNQTGIQKGTFSFDLATGTVMQYTEPVKMTIEIKPDGTVLMNGSPGDAGTSAGFQMGDIYFLYFANNYKYTVKMEDSNYTYLAGYAPTQPGTPAPTRTAVMMRYDRNLKVIDTINYLGTGKDFPYDITAHYIMIQGMPILSGMDMRVSAFSVNVKSKMSLDNIELVKK